MTDPTCPATGQPMFRDVRPMTISYKGRHAVTSALLLLDRDPSGLSVLKERVGKKAAA